jgi:hypothetical protein
MTAEEFYKDHFGHTSQHVSMDKIFVCMELYAKEYANKRVIEELENIPHLETPLGEEIRLSFHYVLKRIKELKQ